MRAGRFRASLLILAAAPALHTASPAKAPPGNAARPAATRDWSQVVVSTPEGGFRMGNPSARLKLIEFGSITCSHCADFNARGAPVLRDRYVRSGQVSWEYRPFMIFPTDPGIFMLLSCADPRDFFSASDRLYAEQRAWVGRLGAVPRAEQERIQALSPQDQMAALVRATGVDQLFRERGMSAARVDTCLADEARLSQLVEISRNASESLGVKGTPTFMLNGRILDGVSTWEALEPRLAKGG